MPEDMFESALNEAETAIQTAMLGGDVSALAMLISDDLRFVGPDGRIVGKAADLEAHRSGAIRFTRIDEIVREVKVFETTGSTMAQADVTLYNLGSLVEARLQWDRSWAFIDGRWQVVSGQVATTG